MTYDNWFSSIPLFYEMLKVHKFTILRKNKREVTAKLTVSRKEKSALLAFYENKTLISFAPRESKIVSVLSTQPFDNTINQETVKPQIILDYKSAFLLANA